MDNYKIKDLQIRLEKETKKDAHKMIYMWIKQNILSLKEYQYLVNFLTIPVFVVEKRTLCEGLHNTDFMGKCFKCGEQVFVRQSSKQGDIIFNKR